LREIQTEGYPGGYTMLLQYIAPKRALRPSAAGRTASGGAHWDGRHPAGVPG
jgi:hypothetical protein